MDKISLQFCCNEFGDPLVFAHSLAVPFTVDSIVKNVGYSRLTLNLGEMDLWNGRIYPFTSSLFPG
ncbi:MAG: hypothetical protein V3W14_04080 [Candidatus Neomarinimicrobiota bacterium]